MAEVFKAKAFGVEGFERLLAVKRILASIAEDTEFISMFIDEAKIAGRLNHANIAQIFDLGKADGSYFIAMEYISGLDCRGIFDRYRRVSSKLGVDMACYCVMKVCEGLDYAHNKTDSLGNPLNIVHRDISPQNILVSYEGEVKIIDFGIAKAAGKSTQTQVGILKGKFSYMSPEQVRGLTLDRRSDLFSLSIVLYELLTLERLFLGESDFETLEKIRKVEVAPPTLYNPHVPKELEDIVLKGLAKDPNLRYQTGHEMQQALQKFMFNQSLYFTNKDLAATMQEHASDELRSERQKLEYYQTLDLETIRRQSGEIPEPSVQRGDSSLDWDDDEVATTVYHGGEDDLIDVITELDFEEDDDWGVSENTPRNSLAPPPPPPVPASEFRAETGSVPITSKPSSEDGWDKIVAKEAEGAVQERPSPAATVKRPSGIYTPAGGSGRNVGLALVIVCALFLGIGGAYWFIQSRTPDISLVFSPEPGNVSILLDERIIYEGETPYTYTEATPGTYTLTLLAPNYQNMTGEIELEEGGTYDINWTLIQEEAPGVDCASTPAGARIIVDGADTGLVTPATVAQLSRGEHQIELQRDGFIAASERIVLAEDPISVEKTLVVEQFRVLLQLEPANARYLLNDAGTGAEISEGQGSAELAELDGSMRYLLFVEADGYRRHSAIIEAAGEATVSLQVVLEATEEAPVVENAVNREQVIAVEDAATAELARARAAERERERAREREERRNQADQNENADNTEQTDQDDDENEQVAENTQDDQNPNEDGDQDTEDEQAPVVVEETSNEPGSLSVQSRPSAGVQINGRQIGYTPIRNLPLEPGRYRVRLVNEDFGLDYERTVTIDPGENEQVIHRME